MKPRHFTRLRNAGVGAQAVEKLRPIRLRIDRLQLAPLDGHRLHRPAPNVVPAAVTAGDKIEALRQWASDTLNLDELRRDAVRRALAATAGHYGRAAALLGVAPKTMTKLAAEARPGTVAKRGRGPRKPLPR